MTEKELIAHWGLLCEDEEGYEPPYTADEVLDNYGEETFRKLYSDPCHRWRMETGIELIHKEPTREEFYRILNNWKMMDDSKKRLSDEKSVELFGVDNMTHAEDIRRKFSW